MEPRLMNFLLVEDDDGHAELLLRTIKRQRVANTLGRVADGEAALADVRGKRPYRGRVRPDIILLDLKLPKLDGLDVLKAIKEDPRLCATPVVILTTSDSETDRLAAYEHHANSYIVKPVNFARFRKMVEDLSLYWGIWSVPPETRTLDDEEQR